MTILFTGSKYGNSDTYRRVIQAVKDLGHQVRVREVLAKQHNLSEKSDKTSNAKFKRDLEICDFMIADISDISLSLGLEIATAMAKNKHVLAISTKQKSMDDLADYVQESSSRYIHFEMYTPQTIAKVLADMIKKIRKQLNYVLYVELGTEYGRIIEEHQTKTAMSKKQIVQEALVQYKPEEK